MAIEIVVPKLGWSMDEGTFVEWLKKDGDEVKAGDLLFALESDKAVQEIESMDSGILRIPPNGPQKDEVVKVGQVLGYLAALGEVEGQRSEIRGRRSEVRNQRSDSHSTGKQEIATRSSVTEKYELSAPRTVKAPAVSPRAAKLALEKGVDLRAVRGTGKIGRITEKDVIAVKSGAIASDSSKSRPTAGSIKAIPPTARRKIIAERMLKSHSATAPVTLTMQVDASGLVSLRNQLKTDANGNACPTYNDLFIKIAALALGKHPGLNASWEDDRIVIHDAVNIGIAVDTDAGLLVPVLRDAPGLGLRALAAKTRDLAGRARQRKLSPDECSGGTFTVSNLGATGVDAFTPIINYPECAVLGIGRIALQPAMNESGAVVSKPMVWLSLTFDHRIIDGAPAARFLETIRKCVENPDGKLTQWIKKGE